jgi:hypothetical protein
LEGISVVIKNVKDQPLATNPCSQQARQGGIQVTGVENLVVMPISQEPAEEGRLPAEKPWQVPEALAKGGRHLESDQLETIPFLSNRELPAPIPCHYNNLEPRCDQGLGCPLHPGVWRNGG